MNATNATTGQKIDTVRAIACALAPLTERYLGKDCLAFYAYGSVFTNDFDPLHSGIDFSAFLTREIDETILGQIHALHRELTELCPAACELEGEYYFLNKEHPWAPQCIVLVEHGSEPRLDLGSFDPDLAEMIRSHGFTLWGRDAQLVLPNTTWSMTANYYRSYLSETLLLLDRDDAPAGLVWRKTLNCCRAFYAIVNGNIPMQKQHVVYWVMGRLPEYGMLIQRALDIRAGECLPVLDPYREALRDMLHAFLDGVLPATCPEGFAKPMRTEIQITTKCNCACPHCGYFTINNRDQASVERISSYLAELRQTWGWIDRVLLEGGEPTTEFHRLLGCIRAARALNVPNIQVNSNLVGVTVSQVAELISAGCNYLEVSVDAITENGWRIMRGMPATEHTTRLYEQFLQTLHFVCSCPELIVDFNYTPTVFNILELEEVYRRANEYGARYFSFQNLICSSADIRTISLPLGILCEKLNRCVEEAAHWSFPTTILMCCAEALEGGESLMRFSNPCVEAFPCSCGEKYLYMNHTGELRACCFGEGLTLGRYREGELAAIWAGRECAKHRCPVVGI